MAEETCMVSAVSTVELDAAVRRVLDSLPATANQLEKMGVEGVFVSDAHRRAWFLLSGLGVM